MKKEIRISRYEAFSSGYDEYLQKLKKRNSFGGSEVTASVMSILDSVRERGDAALVEFTKLYDGVDFSGMSIKVTQEEIDAACNECSPELLNAIRRAKDNIEKFHAKQKQQSWFSAEENGSILGQINTPLEKIGVYVPGGTAPLVSSLLMSVVPGRVAGVSRIYAATPPGKDGKIAPAILAAAKEAGCDGVFRIGGAQAVAAFAYGTQSVPAVDKIFGPGNIYVATAKRMVYGITDIDMFAGPSEITILADEAADPAFVAADMLSQAEHDALAASVLVTDSGKLAAAVVKELEMQYRLLLRKDIIQKSLEDYGAIIITKNTEEALKVVNTLAPEHLELQVKEPFEQLGKIRNAGAIFVGAYSGEPAGDYYAGPNHILPTGGTARFFSPLSVSDYMKRMSVISYTRPALDAAAQDIAVLAEAEGLYAHANAVRIRTSGVVNYEQIFK